MKVLIGCEFSGVVREAFAARGHDAWSCDLLETEIPGNHIQGDVLEVIDGESWDMMIAHPPCTHLAVSGARWFANKRDEQDEAIAFFLTLVTTNIERVCVENPIGIMSSIWRKPDQIVQPWWFGDQAQKSTCLWLSGLKPLVATNVVEKGEMHVTKSGKCIPQWYNMPPSEGRAKERSRTFKGFAQAMAAQWG